MKQLVSLAIGLGVTIIGFSQELTKHAPGQLILGVRGELYNKCKTFVQGDEKSQALMASDSLFSKLGIIRIEYLHMR